MITTVYLGEIKAVGTVPFSFLLVKTEIKQHLPLKETEPDGNAQLFNAFKG